MAKDISLNIYLYLMHSAKFNIFVMTHVFRISWRYYTFCRLLNFSVLSFDNAENWH